MDHFSKVGKIWSPVSYILSLFRA